MKKWSLLIVVTIAVALSACSKKDKKSSVPIAPPPPVDSNPNSPNGTAPLSDIVLNDITEGVYVLDLIGDELTARQNNEATTLPEDLNPAQINSVQMIADHFLKTNCKIESKTSTRYGNNVDTISLNQSIKGKRCGLELETQSLIKENNFGDIISESSKLKVKLVQPELGQANKVFYTHLIRAQLKSFTSINTGNFQFYTFGKKQFLTGTIASQQHGQVSVIGTIESKVTGNYPSLVNSEIVEIKLTGQNANYTLKKVIANKDNGGLAEHFLNDQVISQYQYELYANRLGIL